MIVTAALAFTAAREASMALSARSLPEADVWPAMARLQVWGLQGRPPDNEGIEWPTPDWRAARAALASWTTSLLRESGVATVADWSGHRLVLAPQADGLFGTLALLLARDIGQGQTYRCDVCGEPVDPYRPPLANERVYCTKPACKKEQRRRNQASWRAKKKAEQEGAS